MLELYYFSRRRFALPLSPDQILALLDDQERERYARFLRDEPRELFSLARWLCKTRLALHLGCAPQSLRFDYTESGKPYLANQPQPLQFSIAHTESAVLVAISTNAVGVDVEMMDRRGDPWREAESFLNPVAAEHIALAGNEDERKRAFARYWTAMEALVKLEGTGLFRWKDRIGFEQPVLQPGAWQNYHGQLLLCGETECGEAWCVASAKAPQSLVLRSWAGQGFSAVDTF